jgi:hypothetical protein
MCVDGNNAQRDETVDVARDVGPRHPARLALDTGRVRRHKLKLPASQAALRELQHDHDGVFATTP